MAKIQKSEQEWREQLDQETYRVTREQGTEYPGTGKYLDHFELGAYNCVCCGEPLFTSEQKFNSHCGWPSFDDCIEHKVEYRKDHTHGMTRIEIICSSCDAHLGHVFDDGPTETGKRFCVNSVSLSFEGNK